MPQFEPSTFTPQLFWLAVTFSVLFFAMWRHALPRISGILEARRQRIDGELEKAQAFKSEAEQVAAEYEMALAEARDKAAAALKQAVRTGEAQQRIAAARDAAIGSIRTVAEETAGAATAKLIGVELSPGQLRDAVEDALRRRG
jgi:F-type H+-transporting ATPase subunit b